MPREEWRARLGLSAREGGDVVEALAAAGDLAEVTAGAPAARGAFVGGPGHEPRLTAEQEQRWLGVLARFRREPYAPPTRPEVEDELGVEVTAALIERGTLVRVSETILLEAGAYVEARCRVVEHLRTHETLTVADARDLLGTTRKYMLAIFEHLDEQRITRRRGDDRVLGPAAPGPAAPGPAAAVATDGERASD